MHLQPTRPLIVAALATAALLTFGCQSSTKIDAVQIQAPTTTTKEAVHMPGLHNVVTYRPELVCGGVPEGEEGFRTLAAMGIKTVVSVDGMTPDLKSAEANGLRYVHLPISYDTVSPERQKQLAQAIHNLPKPIYMHCHHGKHRSASALGTALVCAGRMTPDEVVERMHVSGTAESYEGLWAAVHEAKPLTFDELRADPASFPSITKVTGMVAMMAEIDQVIDLVKQAHEAGWRAPDDHPDLVATKETKRLAKLFADLRKDNESQAYPDDYQQMLRRSIDLSSDLDVAVRAGNSADAAELLTTLGKACKECHRSYRNK